MIMYRGLPCNFRLVCGKFELTQGKEKVKNDLSFFLAFATKGRIYLPDFTPDLMNILQKPTSYIIQMRTVILVGLQGRINKYVAGISLNRLGMEYVRVLKQFAFYLDYTYTFDENETDETIVFI